MLNSFINYFFLNFTVIPNKPNKRNPKILVGSGVATKTEIVSPLKLATAKSSLLSLLKSPMTTALAASPTLKLRPTFRTSKCRIKKLQSLSILRSQLGKNIEYFYFKL